MSAPRWAILRQSVARGDDDESEMPSARELRWVIREAKSDPALLAELRAEVRRQIEDLTPAQRQRVKRNLESLRRAVAPEPDPAKRIARAGARERPTGRAPLTVEHRDGRRR